MYKKGRHTTALGIIKVGIPSIWEAASVETS